jgi:ureidoacrylate peracid hydrolase
MEIAIPAKPEPINLDTERTGLIVVDMQNAFCKKDGMLDVLGKLDEAKAKHVIETDRKVIKAARRQGIKVFYLRQTYGPDLAAAGGPETPNYWKEQGFIAMRKNPEWRGKFLTINTWDWQLIDELRPQPEDIIVNKPRYSGFVKTRLDSILKKQNLTHLIFIGIATNACVESTIRDAYFHDYFPIMVSDGCGNAGPDYTQKASIWNVADIFGWVTTSRDLIKALK